MPFYTIARLLSVSKCACFCSHRGKRRPHRFPLREERCGGVFERRRGGEAVSLTVERWGLRCVRTSRAESRERGDLSARALGDTFRAASVPLVYGAEEPCQASRRAMRRQTSSTFSLLLKAEMRKNPSPWEPKPAPGVMTTRASSSILSKNSQLPMPWGVCTQT